MMLNHPAMTLEPFITHVTFHNTRQPPVPPSSACPSQQETTQQQTNWEALAHQSNFRPSLLARRCCVSLRTLERHFIKHYQVTVSEFLRKMRLTLAYTRLQRGERAKSVAYDLGYKQPSHFSRDFKNFYGVPPRAIKPDLLQLLPTVTR